MKTERRRERRCRCCGVHHAIFFVRGRVKADRNHDLCRRCFCRELDRLRAKLLSEAA